MAERTPQTVNPRRLALQLLERCQAAGSYSNLALDSVLQRTPLQSADKGLLTALVYGCIERQVTLDWYLSQLSDRPLKQLDNQVLTILRIGLYQLLFMDRIPEHAAVNESVSLTPRRSAGFVNAVLRNYIRRKNELNLPDAVKDPILYMSVKTSVPAGLCSRLSDAYGIEKTFQILSAFGQHDAITLRVNQLRISRPALLDRLKSAGIAAAVTSYSSSGIIVPEMPVREIPGYDEGLFFIQDEASQLCVTVLDAHSGMSVLDTCSCPGSKSFGLAIEMENQGNITACDLHANKLSLVSTGAERLGVRIIRTLQHDGQQDYSEPGTLFDRILCDVPCSGFGILGKKPEIRHKSMEDIKDLPRIQYSILCHSAKQLKTGGKLVYSTCTLLPEENENNIHRFLEEHPDFKPCDTQSGALPIPGGLITLTPDVHHTDGFFIAVLRKEK